MLILAIVLLILLGIALLAAEFFVAFGSIIVGVSGLILASFGVFLTYINYGSIAGNYTLLTSLALLTIAILVSLRARTWKKIALHSEMEGKVNSITEYEIKAGDKGITVSRLAPMGKVRINNTIVEAKSLGIYVEENTPVEVVKSNKTNIVVKPLN